MTDNARLIRETIASIASPDEHAASEAAALQARLTKPARSLGRLEDIHMWAASVLRDPAPPPLEKVIVVAAGDHGVTTEDVSAYPADVTAQMVRNFCAGGAAVNALAAHAGARLLIVDAGASSDFDDESVVVAKVRRGAANIAREPGMSRDECESLMAAAIRLTQRELPAASPVAVGLGDMGIGNTTPAAAITSVLTGAPPSLTVGRGTGIDDARFRAKVAAVERAIAINEPLATNPIDTLAHVGGCEIAFLAGIALGAAACGALVVLDGYPTTSAALITAALAPGSRDYMLASHLSAEPGHRIALEKLGLRPLLEFDMRLGEGTGAALAMTIVDAALRLPREMATFDAAGVSRSTSEVPQEA